MSKSIGSTLLYAVVQEQEKITAKTKTRSNQQIKRKVQEIIFKFFSERNINTSAMEINS